MPDSELIAPRPRCMEPAAVEPPTYFNLIRQAFASVKVLSGFERPTHSFPLEVNMNSLLPVRNWRTKTWWSVVGTTGVRGVSNLAHQEPQAHGMPVIQRLPRKRDQSSSGESTFVEIVSRIPITRPRIRVLADKSNLWHTATLLMQFFSNLAKLDSKRPSKLRPPA